MEVEVGYLDNRQVEEEEVEEGKVKEGVVEEGEVLFDRIPNLLSR